MTMVRLLAAAAPRKPSPPWLLRSLCRYSSSQPWLRYAWENVDSSSSTPGYTPPPPPPPPQHRHPPPVGATPPWPGSIAPPPPPPFAFASTAPDLGRAPPLPPAATGPSPPPAPPQEAGGAGTSCDTLIDSLQRRGLLQELDTLIRAMKAADIVVGSPAYMALFGLFSQHNDIERMDAVYAEMRRAMVARSSGQELSPPRPSSPQQKQEASFLFASLIDSCHRRGLLEEVQHAHKTMKAAELSIPVPTYRQVIDSLSQLGDFQQMDAVYFEMREAMKRRGPVPSPWAPPPPPSPPAVSLRPQTRPPPLFGDATTSASSIQDYRLQQYYQPPPGAGGYQPSTYSPGHVQLRPPHFQPPHFQHYQFPPPPPPPPPYAPHAPVLVPASTEQVTAEATAENEEHEDDEQEPEEEVAAEGENLDAYDVDTGDNGIEVPETGGNPQDLMESSG